MSEFSQKMLKDLKEYKSEKNKLDSEKERLSNKKSWIEEECKKNGKRPPSFLFGGEIDPPVIFSGYCLFFAIPIFIFFLICVLTINDPLGKLISEILLGICSIYILIPISIFVYNHILINIDEKIYDIKCKSLTSKYDAKYKEECEKLEEKTKEFDSKFSQLEELFLNAQLSHHNSIYIEDIDEWEENFREIFDEYIDEYIDILKNNEEIASVKDIVRCYEKTRDEELERARQENAERLEQDIRDRAFYEEQNALKLQQEADRQTRLMEEEASQRTRELKKQTELMQKQLEEQKRANREAERNARRNDFGPAGCIHCPHYTSCKSENFTRCRKSIGLK